METTKTIGIWMDHSTAHLIDIEAIKRKKDINSEFTFSMKEEALSRSENIMHNKEQQMHDAYYAKIGEEILKYNHVLLFGPTHAKTELYNFVNKDLHFKDITIDIEAADNMTENEKVAFVENHFKK